jgi:hypothetical protein
VPVKVSVLLESGPPALTAKYLIFSRLLYIRRERTEECDIDHMAQELK